MIHLKKALSVLAVSFLVTLSSCDPNGPSTSSQIYWNGVPLVFENVGDSHSWFFDLDSCESTFLCSFDVYFSVSPSDFSTSGFYEIYSTGSFDTSGTLYRYYDDNFTSLKNDWDSGRLDNFKIEGNLYSYHLYWLSIDARPNDDAGLFNFFRVYLEKKF